MKNRNMQPANSTGLLAILTIVGLILGVVLGYLTPDFMLGLKFVGQLFLGAMMLLAVALIISSIVSGISAIGDMAKLRRLTGKTILFFLTTGVVAIIIGIGLVLLLAPSADIGTASIGQFQHEIYQSTGSVLEAFDLDSSFLSVGRGHYLFLILFAFLLGAALSTTAAKSPLVISFFAELNQVLLRLVEILFYAAPIGVMSLVGTAVASADFTMIGGFATGYLLTLGLATLILGIVVLPISLKLYGGGSIVRLFGHVSPSLLAAVGVSSSSMVLPFTYEAITARAQIDERSGSIVPPLGTIFNIAATSLFTVITAGFIMQSIIGNIDIGLLAMVGLMSGLLSIGTSGLPLVGIGILIGAMSAVGITSLAESSIIGLIVTADLLIVDRLRAALNVWGDAVGSAVIGETFELKTVRVRPGAARRVERTTRPKTEKRERVTRTTGTGQRREREARKSSTVATRSGRAPKSDAPKPAKKSTDRRQAAGKSGMSKSPFGFSPGETIDLDIETGGKPVKLAPRNTARANPVRKESSKPEDNRRPGSSRSTVAAKISSPRKLSGAEEKKPSVSPIPRDTLKRERERVSAQLEAMRRERNEQKPDVEKKPERIFAETKPDPIAEPAVTPPPAPEKVAKPEPKPTIDFTPEIDAVVERRPADPVPSFDQQSEDTKPVEAPVIEPPAKPAVAEPEISAPEPTEPVADVTDEPEPTFGRTRPRKGVVSKTSDATAPTESSDPADSDEKFSTQNMDFGRAKRKRIR